MLEENPFEDQKIAQEWIEWAETKNYEGTRYTDIYPRLKRWAQEIKPKTIVDIGAGQGIASEYLGIDDIQYIGIEPSAHLVKRAQELYKEENKKFLVGNAYNLPLPADFTDAACSVNVWFHLKDIKRASEELARILKPQGKFLIITANPATYNVWKTFFTNMKENRIMFTGRIAMNQNFMSRNDFYLHPLEDITKALEDSQLVIDETESFGYKEEYADDGLQVCFKGHRA